MQHIHRKISNYSLAKQHNAIGNNYQTEEKFKGHHVMGVSDWLTKGPGA
jgi:hypothetical protein